MAATATALTAFDPRWKATLWWVAPTSNQTLLAWDWFMARVGRFCDVSKSRKMMTMPTGSALWFKSAHEPDNLLGEGVDFLVLDEAARIKNLRYVWQDTLRPMLVDTMGSALFLSTPNRRNLFYRWFLNGQDPTKPDWASWNFPTTENPYLPEAEFDKLLQDYPPGSNAYKEQILGEFIAGEGAVFRRIREAATATPVAPYAGRFVGGVDWGKAQDYTAVFVLDTEQRRMVAMDRFNTVDYTAQRDRIGALHDRWRPEVWHVESNSIGGPNIEMLIRDGLPVRPFQTTAQSKRPLIEALAQAFELGEIAIFNDPVLIGELESYEMRQNANTGALSYSAPGGMHDDTVIALALAWYGVKRAGALMSFA